MPWVFHRHDGRRYHLQRMLWGSNIVGPFILAASVSGGRDDPREAHAPGPRCRPTPSRRVLFVDSGPAQHSGVYDFQHRCGTFTQF